MSNTAQNRDTLQLNKLVQVLLNCAIKEVKAAGINPLVVETYRSQERQNYLYCQGRTVSEAVGKGIDKTFAETYCNPKAAKVTWTLNSEHTTRKAVDLVPQRSNKGVMTAIWNANDEETKKLIAIMEKYGFEAGANWKTNPDSPHFQVKANYTNIFTKTNTNIYITKLIQRNLNIAEDGKWGNATDKAISDFRNEQGYKSMKPMIGATALKNLLS